MTAPLDYADPDGRTIDLALIRAKAAPGPGEERLGSLIFNFGGPGGSGISTLPAFAGDDYMKLHKRYDLVSFDPRGVGESAGVRCLDPKAMDAWLATDSTPDDAAEEKASGHARTPGPVRATRARYWSTSAPRRPHAIWS
jgi:pimeloyl-ACP methyl ester carboxylesterase